MSSTGNIILQRDLRTDPARLTRYTVVLTARDDNTYPLPGQNSCTVTVIVSRNNFDPVFINLPYDRTIDRNTATSSIIVSVNATDRDIVVRSCKLFFKCSIYLLSKNLLLYDLFIMLN